MRISGARFLIHTFRYTLYSISPMCLYRKAIHLAMVYAHTLHEKWEIPTTHVHSMLTTFTQFNQKSTVALYGSIMHVATFKPYLQDI